MFHIKTLFYKAQSFYYIKKPYGYYLNHREGASSTQPFNEKRINELMIIINSLISDDIYVNGYVIALLIHLKKNTPKHFRNLIKVNQIQKLKKFKLLWCPLGTRLITKLFAYIYLNKLFKKSSL